MKKVNLIILFLIAMGVGLQAQWSDNPDSNTVVCQLPGDQAVPKIAAGPTGDIYAGWFSNDSGNYDVRLQRFDSDGNALWEENGLLVSNHPAMTWLTDWDLKVDQDNHVILTFQDIRNAGNNNIYAYRISPEGDFIWGADGLELSNSTAFDASPKALVTSDNNVVIAWSAELETIIMHKISPEGNLLWGQGGIILDEVNSLSWPQLLALDNDEFLLKYYEDSGVPWSPVRHLFVQKFDADGAAVWAQPATVSDMGGISAWTQIISFVGDGNGGCFLAWNDDRDMNMQEDCYLQYIDNTGSAIFGEDGMEISLLAGNQRFYPKVVFFSETEGLYVYWRETDGGENNIGISGQKLNLAGQRLWGNNGNTIIPLAPNNRILAGVSAGDNDQVMIVYEEAHDAVNSLMKGMLLDENGDFVWTEEQVTMSSVLSEKIHPSLTEFANDKWVAIWTDRRDDIGDTYAQNINFDGSLGTLTLSGIAGRITLNGGTGAVNNVEVWAGGVMVHPGLTGNYMIYLDPGTYTVTASLNGYETATIEDVLVETGSITTDIDLILNYIQNEYNPPSSVQVDSYTGTLTWEPPVYAGDDMDEGFESASLPEGWLNVDNDGDGNLWFSYTYSPHSGSRSIASASYLSGQGALTPDNWLISPAIDIGSDSELHFWYAAQDPEWPSDHFAVYLSTTGTEIADFSDIIFETTIEDEIWTEAVVDLSSYMGETVYLAWRHYDCTDWFYMKIDDVSVINSVTRETIFQAGFDIEVHARNYDYARSENSRVLEGYNVYLNGTLVGNATALEYTFDGLIHGQGYLAGVSAVYTGGESDIIDVSFTYTGTGSEENILPNITRLIGNSPNPFNPVTRINFALAEAGQVEITIFNIKGEKVKTLTDEFYEAGNHSLIWDGSNENGKSEASGIYFYKMRTGMYTSSMKMILMK